MNSQQSRYHATKTQIQHTLNLIRWYKSFINSNCEQAYIPEDDFNQTMTKTDAQKHINDSLNRSINQRAGLIIPDNDNKWYGWIRDQHKLEDHFKQRIIIHSFDSKVCRKRFPHLIEPYSDY